MWELRCFVHFFHIINCDWLVKTTRNSFECIYLKITKVTSLISISMICNFDKLRLTVVTSLDSYELQESNSMLRLRRSY